MPEIRRSNVEIIGDEESYGAQAAPRRSREVLCRITVEAEDPSAFAILMREQGTSAVSMTPGIAGSGLASMPMPVARSESFFIPADEVEVTVSLDDRTETVDRFGHQAVAEHTLPPEPPLPEADTDIVVPLAELAWVRSGDKGDICNIGVIARKPAYLPYIAAAMSETGIACHYAHMFRNGEGVVSRHYLPGTASLNFMLENALDGGCTVSLRFDPFGKGAAQDVLELEVPIASALL